MGLDMALALTWTEVLGLVEAAPEVVEVLYEEVGAAEDTMTASERTPSEDFMGAEGEDPQEDLGEGEWEEGSRLGLEELRTEDLNLMLPMWGEVREGRRRVPRLQSPMTWRGRL